MLQNLPVPLLKGCEWLTDEHINHFQYMLKMKYHVNGLESTLLLKQKSEWKSIPVDFVQVLFNGKNHWVCASNIFSGAGEIDVYDSMANGKSLNASVVQQLATILKTPSTAFKINLVRMQVSYMYVCMLCIDVV